MSDPLHAEYPGCNAQIIAGRTVCSCPNDTDIDAACLLLKPNVETYETKAPKVMTVLEAGFDDATAVLVLPERYRKKLRITNGIERLNEEIRRRERVIHIILNRKSFVRLIGVY